MAYTIIDRRLNGKGKSTQNRQKFIRRVKKQVKEAVKEAIRNGNIKDIVSGSGKKINVPIKDLNEPRFHHGKGGMSERIHPGNKDFVQGDRVDRPKSSGGQGGGKGASKDGEGEDSFEFHLSKEEFLDIFFEDLELPDLIKKDMSTIDEFKWRRAGFSPDGTPSRLNIARSMKQSKARRKALRSPKRKRLRELEAERDELQLYINTAQASGNDCSIEKDRLVEVLHEIEVLQRRIKAIPFVDDMDLRYNRWDKVAVPTTQAVMFCVMDVSGSMGEWEKEMSKRFFMLLYLFLTRQYERVDLVFIRHHTIPKEVDEEEFFHSRESGGTLVSPALELMSEIIADRYPKETWNVYGCQASDGDNWPDDSVVAQNILIKDLMKKLQYFAYVEIDQSTNRQSDIWPYYEEIKAQFNNFDMARITDPSTIYPVFRGLFEKR